MFSEDQLKWYDKYNKARPTHISHNITSDDLSEHVRRMQPDTWQLEGNKLTGDTEMGPFVQFLPTDVIMTGVDKDNLPVFDKVKIQ